MLAFLLRGVFLMGFIGWYSVSLWKTVDSYFKSQFQRYLEEEYQRNPRMREDVLAYTTAATVDKAASDLIVDSSSANVVYPIGKADLAREVKRHRDDESVPLQVDFGAAGAAAEIEVARPVTPHTDQPAFQDSPVDEAKSPAAELHEEMPPPVIRNYSIHDSSNLKEIGEFEEGKTVAHEKPEEKKEKEEPKEKENQSPPQTQKKAKAKKRSKIERKSEVATKRKIKQREKIPTLKLSSDDFDEAAGFFEFDYEDGDDGFVDHFENDDDNDVDFKGIRLKDLPFRPMIDVYDLERVSEEEFCPLSLHDDPTCDELRSWP